MAVAITPNFGDPYFHELRHLLGVYPRGLEPLASAMRGRFDVTVQMSSSVVGRGAL